MFDDNFPPGVFDANCPSGSNVEDYCQDLGVVTKDEQWGVRKVIRRRKRGMVIQYLVDWRPTFEPATELDEAIEAVADFNRKVEKTGDANRKKQQADIKDIPDKKRRRGLGRPRKQK